MTTGMKEALKEGNILRTEWPQGEESYLPLYMGSGKAGACMDKWGLMNRPYEPCRKGSLSNTVFLHTDHWHRGQYGLDSILPLFRLRWSHIPEPPKQYRQELHLAEGRLETILQWEKLSIHMNLSFHPYQRDILSLDLHYEADPSSRMPGITLEAMPTLETQGYRQLVCGSVSHIEKESGTACTLLEVKAGTACTLLSFRTLDKERDCVVCQADTGLELHFPASSGRHLILVGACGELSRHCLTDQMDAVTDMETYEVERTNAWNRRWGDAYVCVSDKRHQALWSRSLYDLLSSFCPEPVCPVSPMGFSGNGWPFHFPQDMAYILPVFLQLGHVDIAKGIVDYYRTCLTNMQAFTRRVYGVEGTQWAWEFPMDNQSRLLEDDTPNWFQFELHNAAYPAFMAYETACALGDSRWMAETAWPIIRESACYFTNILQQEDDGTWGIHITPSMGQDEWGGENARNYFCALVSARYCLTIALKAAKKLHLNTEHAAKWSHLLRDGLAFPRLLHPEHGIYMTCEGNPEDFQLGTQKHPIQLSPIAFLPIGMPQAPEKRAYSLRYALCKSAKSHFFTGWSLATFWLAAARLGDGLGFEKDLEEAVPSGYVDRHWTVLFETSRHDNMPMYLTNHALFMQAVHGAILVEAVDAPTGKEKVPSTWKPIKFEQLRLPGGGTASGIIT